MSSYESLYGGCKRFTPWLISLGGDLHAKAQAKMLVHWQPFAAGALTFRLLSVMSNQM